MNSLISLPRMIALIGITIAFICLVIIFVRYQMSKNKK